MSSSGLTHLTALALGPGTLLEGLRKVSAILV